MKLCQHCNRLHINIKKFDTEDICVACWDDIAEAAIAQMIALKEHNPDD